MVNNSSSEISKPISRMPGWLQAFLFIVPMVVTTGASILLFSQITGFTPAQQNTFSVIILSAVIISLLGMAGVQLLVYRFIEKPEYKDGAAIRSVTAGLLFAFLFSILISLIVSPYFLTVLGFTPTEYLLFFILILLFSATWVFTSAFWALELYEFPALVFVAAYAIIFGLTLYLHNLNPQYTLLGYIIGTAFLPMLFGIIGLFVFKKPKLAYKISGDFMKLMKLTAGNLMPILYNILYTLCVFLDKIIVWVFQGATAGNGLLITDSYTAGSFLGLIPMLSIGILAYFTGRAKGLVNDRYLGTLPHIQTKVIEYKRLYWKSFTMLLFITVGLIILVNIAGLWIFRDMQTLLVLTTISIGSLFLVSIIFNASVLPLFGKAHISTIAVLMVVVFELASILLVSYDTWYCAIAFSAGSLIGAAISFISLQRMFGNFEYNMFRYVASMPTK